MSRAYRAAVAALDALSTAELVALLGEISVRLQAQINITEDEPADDSLDTQDMSRRYLPRLPQLDFARSSSVAQGREKRIK